MIEKIVSLIKKISPEYTQELIDIYRKNIIDNFDEKEEEEMIKTMEQQIKDYSDFYSRNNHEKNKWDSDTSHGSE